MHQLCITQLPDMHSMLL